VAALAADQVLIGFSSPKELEQVIASDAQFALSMTGDSPALRVSTGKTQPWPGITIKAPSGGWNLTAWQQISFQVTNTSLEPVTINCRVDNPGADGKVHCVTASLKLEKGRSGILQVPLTRTGDDKLDGSLFGMRGYPKKTGGPGTIDPANINQLIVFVAKPAKEFQFEIREIRASGAYTPPIALSSDADPFFPFIDTFGQYRHKDWPGKVASLGDLKSRVNKEEAELQAKPEPQTWNKYGGYADGPKLKATGFFRTEKVKGKWWLVDPDGRLFFSQGIDCVRMVDYTPVEERSLWFHDFPGGQPELASFFSQARVLKGHFEGKLVRCYPFAAANLCRKYGSDWRKSYPQLVHRRLRSWGINTIANWSDENTFLMRRTAYTDNIGSGRTRMIEGSEGYWGKFPDVFDRSFEESLQRAMSAKKRKSAGDAWCIGYFSDNEMSWGDETSIALAALKSPSDQPAKLALVGDLKIKYAEISALNTAWASGYASWQALLESKQTPNPDKAGPDLKAFYTKAAERYFRTVKNAIRAVAPEQLYLGCRFAWVNERAAAAAAKYCDVVSYNLYQRNVADFEFNGGADVPLLIGEFHFGALDRGMFHTGLVPVENQNARAQAYRDYVLGALKHSQFVGTHWFQYQDEPVTGRVLDEENYQIGFVDVADTPYPEMVDAARQVASRLYAQ
jgi:hypothetical protein